MDKWLNTEVGLWEVSVLETSREVYEWIDTHPFPVLALFFAFCMAIYALLPRRWLEKISKWPYRE